MVTMASTLASTSFVWGGVGQKGWLLGGVADCGNSGRSPAGGGLGLPRPWIFVVDWLAREANWANFCVSGTRL